MNLDLKVMTKICMGNKTDKSQGNGSVELGLRKGRFGNCHETQNDGNPFSNLIFQFQTEEFRQKLRRITEIVSPALRTSSGKLVNASQISFSSERSMISTVVTG